MAKRRTERVFLRIPIQVSGEDKLGKPLVEESKTVHISRYGALLELRSMPREGSELAIRNLSNGLTANSRIIHTESPGKDASAECGVELIDAPRDFWGVIFEEPAGSEEFRIFALLFCTSCGQKVLAGLSADEYRALATASTLRRSCARCAGATDWVVAPSEEDEEEEAASPDDTQPSAIREEPAKPLEEKTGIERRQARRLALKVPLRVQGSTGPAEMTVAEDMSKTGFKFGCSLEFAAGEQIHIAVGQGVATNPPMQAYKVVWRTPKERSSRYVYGVTILKKTQ